MADVPVYYYNQTSQASDIKSKWWSQPKDEMHRHIFGVVSRIESSQKCRSLENLKHARLYHDIDFHGLAPGLFSKSIATPNRMTLNVIKSGIDTVAAKMAKDKTKPFFITEDGIFEKQQRCQRLNDYVEGKFEQLEMYSLGQMSFLDSGVFGTGATYFFPEGGEVKAERSHIDEIIVDETEGMYGSPRQLHRRRYVFREVLMDLYPKFSEDIKAAPNGLPSEHINQTAADMVKVIESWHLPSSKDAKDGYHAISIENKTLVGEPYKRMRFPFVFRRWSRKTLGFFGMGIAEELTGIQIEINRTLRTIQMAQRLVAVPQVWIEKSSHIVKSHINNEIGGVKEYVGQPPIFMTPTAVPPELYQHVENLYRKAYEIIGVSQLSANSQKPAGLTAGVALRTMSDIETERFMIAALENERYYLEAADLIIDLTEELSQTTKGLSVKARTNKAMKKINWSEAKMDREDFSIRAFPTSLLPSEPGAKLQKVQELTQAGYFEKEDAMSLLDFPDTDRVTKRITAPRDIALMMIDRMIEKGEYISPEPFMDVNLAKNLCQYSYLRAKIEGVSEDRLELLRTFMADCDRIINPQAQGPVPGPQPGTVPQMGGQPLAQPQGQPTSDLLPIVGGAA